MEQNIAAEAEIEMQGILFFIKTFLFANYLRRNNKKTIHYSIVNSGNYLHVLARKGYSKDVR